MCNFIDAIKMAMDGKRMGRQHWQPSANGTTYIITRNTVLPPGAKDESIDFLYLIHEGNVPADLEYSPTVQDIIADDWMEYPA